MNSNFEKLATIINPDVDVIDVPMKDIRIMDKNRILVFGEEALMQESAYRKLLKSLSQSQAGLDVFDTINKGAGLTAVNEVLKKGKLHYTMAFDGREVTRIGTTDSMQRALNGEQFYNIMEQITETRNDIEIAGIFTDYDGLGATIQIMNSMEKDHPLMSGETIKQGFSIDFDRFSGISIQAFVRRLVCTNGAMMRQDRARRMLDLTQDPSVWYDQLFNETTNKAVVDRYWDAVVAAGGTQMSVRELNQLNSFLFTNFSKDTDKFGPLLNDDWRLQYTANGHNLNEYDASKLAQCPTPINKWEAINVLTDVVSHNTKSVVDDRTRTKGMMLAGNLLEPKDGHDSRLWLLNIPSFSN